LSGEIFASAPQTLEVVPAEVVTDPPSFVTAAVWSGAEATKGWYTPHGVTAGTRGRFYARLDAARLRSHHWLSNLSFLVRCLRQGA